jgi:BirA family biotin operon repressor/biotin-[acetyl-CoA-carboxylase] ligase
MSQTPRSELFRVDSQVDARGRQAVERLFRDSVCAAIDYRRTTESTNTLALADLTHGNDSAHRNDFARRDDVALVDGHLACPKLYLADEQTSGRGRRGRRWISSHTSLTFSLVVPRRDSQPIPLAPLWVGVGIARFLEFEFAPLQVRLKWPNDVHVGGGKLAGVLIETASIRPDRLVIGVGMNVGEAPQLEPDPPGESLHGSDPSSAPHPAQSLAAVLGREVERYDLLDDLIRHLLQSLEEGETQADHLLESFRERCLLTGQRVRFRDRDGFCEGYCRGVSDSGSLVVETDAGLRNLHSGEANLVRTGA